MGTTIEPAPEASRNPIESDKPFFAPSRLKASAEKNRLHTRVAPYNLKGDGQQKTNAGKLHCPA